MTFRKGGTLQKKQGQLGISNETPDCSVTFKTHEIKILVLRGWDFCAKQKIALLRDFEKKQGRRFSDASLFFFKVP